MIRFENGTKVYKDKTVGVKNINLTLPDKGLIVIEGKSGSGKTTLLNLISGIMKPTEGKVYYNGKDINRILNYTDMVGTIFQDYNLISDLNVIDNINFIGNSRTDELIKLLGIEDLKKKRIDEISGGEARRVAIARSLNKGVKILLCDEPTESLDKENEESILGVLKKISENILVIVVSHKEVVRKYADRLITVSKSEIVEDKIINEDKTSVSDINVKSKIKLSKLLKMSFFRILDNLGLFSLNLSSLVLVFTLFLGSLVLKGMDLNRVEVKTMIDNNEHRLVIEDAYSSVVSKTKLDNLNIKYDEVYSYNLNAQVFGFDLGHSNENIGAFYLSNISMPKAVVVGDNTFLDSDEIVGELPDEKNEILISEYTFEGFKFFGLKGLDGEYKNYFNIDEIIGKSILLGRQEVIVTGVLKQNIEPYESFKKITFVEGYAEEVIFSMFINSVADLNYIYVTPEFDNYISYKSKNVSAYLVNSDDEGTLYKAKSLDDGKIFEVKGTYTGNLFKLKQLVKRLKIFGSIVLVVFLIIGIILISNYFSNSTQNHEKDNRVLKYLGLSNIRMFTPYLFESIMLIGLSSIIGTSIVFIVCNALNNFYAEILFSNMKLFSVSLSNIMDMLLFIVSIIFVLSIFNIMKISKSIKKYTE